MEELGKGFERGHNVPYDVVSDAVECVADKPIDSGTSLVEAYLANRLRIHLHLHTRPSDRLAPFDYVCTIFEPPSHRRLARQNGVISDPLDVNIRPREYGVYNVQEAVLVTPIQVMEKPKRMKEWLGATVRLQPLDLCLGRNPDMLDRLRRPSPGLILENGEGAVLRPPKRTSLGGEGVGELVESGPEVKKNIANHGTEPNGDFLPRLEPHDIVTGIRLEIGFEFVGFVFDKLIQDAVQGIQMYVRTV